MRSCIVIPALTVVLGTVVVAPASGAQVPQGEQAVVDLFEAASPAVVSITTTTTERSGTPRRTRTPHGVGTGFIWDRAGHVVTTFSVVQGAAEARVVLHDETSYLAEYVGGSARHDLAVLRIEAPAGTLRPVTPGDSDRLAVGRSVYAIGNPLGLAGTLTSGIVSALDRRIAVAQGDLIDGIIQIDAAIGEGHKGGPVFDSGGRLIGVNSRLASASGRWEGIGFAVPVTTVRRVVPQLIASGEYVPARLGIRLADPGGSPSEVERPGPGGVLIDQVLPNTGAARAGLRGTQGGRGARGDIILRVDGEEVTSRAELRLLLDHRSRGDEVEVTIWRGGEEYTLPVTLS